MPTVTDDKLERLVERDEVREFLIHESELLDNREMDRWHDLLAEGLTYEVPIRITREQAHSSREEVFSDTAFHLQEDKTTIGHRIRRIETEHAWAQNPPPRIRHIIGNLRIPESTDEYVDTITNVLIYRNRGDTNKTDLISGERFDRLDRSEGEYKLARRRVLLDHVNLKRDLEVFL